MIFSWNDINIRRVFMDSELKQLIPNSIIERCNDFYFTNIEKQMFLNMYFHNMFIHQMFWHLLNKSVMSNRDNIIFIRRMFEIHQCRSVVWQCMTNKFLGEIFFRDPFQMITI